MKDGKTHILVADDDREILFVPVGHLVSALFPTASGLESGDPEIAASAFSLKVPNFKESLQPVYLEAKEDSIPEVKRVIVVYGDQIAYKSTLAEALNSLFGEGSANADVSSDDSSAGSGELSQSEIIIKAQEAFSNAEEAQKNGDWAKYGQYLNELEKYLNML